MAISFHEGIYGGGKRTELGIGTHYNIKASSIYVPEGYKFSHYSTIEEKEKEPAFAWYAGKYEDVSVYRIPRTLKRVVIEKTDLLRKQMAIAKWWVDVGTGGKNFPIEIPLTTEHALLNFWTGSGTGGIDLLDDNIEKLYVPEGLSVKSFIDHFDISNPNVIKTTPGLLISGPKEVDFSKDPFKKYYKSISIMSIGGVSYKLLSMEVDESTADWESYTTVGGKNRADNDTPMEAASVGVEIAYEETQSQTDGWEAGFGIEMSNETQIGSDASFVKTTFGVTLSVNASWHGETGKEKTKATTLTANATLDSFTACDAEVIVEMKKGEVDAIRRWLNMETGVVVEQKGRIEFDQYADSTTRFSNYVELQTPAAIEWRKQREEEGGNTAFENWQKKRKAAAEQEAA